MSVNGDHAPQVEDGPRRYLPQLLTPQDMNRARDQLGDVLNGRTAYDLLEDDYDRVPLTIWCLETRTNPGFSWAEALATPYLGEWKAGPAGPPTTAAPPAGGVNDAASGSSKRRTAPATGP